MKRTWYLAASLALTVIIGFLVYRTVPDWGEAWRVMLGGSPAWFLAALATGILHMVLRSLRWGKLLSPVKAGIAFGNLFSLTLVKYVVNVIPPRVGEVAASVALARKERIPALSVIAASVFERVLDSAAVLVLFGIYLVFMAGRHMPDSARGREILETIRMYSLVGMAVLALVLAALLLLLRSRRWHSWTPAVIRRYAVSFVEGFRALQSRAAMAEVAALSFAIWLVIGVHLWSLVRAYVPQFPFSGSLLILALTVVGVAIPTPGGVGGYQLFMGITLVYFFGHYLSPHDPQSQAAGISNGCYIVSMGPVLALGLFFLHREGLSFGQLSKISSADESAGGASGPPGY